MAARDVLFLGVGLILLSACASLDGLSDTSPEAEAGTILPNGALPAQALQNGECGLFGFSKSSRKLVFFANAERADYVSSDNRLVRVQPDGEFPAADYNDGSLRLVLGRSETLEGGQRYAAARLSDVQPDGFTRIQPIVALVTCEAPTGLT